MPQLRSSVVKAREVCLTYHVDETNQDEVNNLGYLREQGVEGFEGRRVDLKLTPYLTVHDVLAVIDIDFQLDLARQQRYMDGSSNPARANVTIRLLVSSEKTALLDPKHVIVDSTSLIPIGDVRLLESHHGKGK